MRSTILVTTLFLIATCSASLRGLTISEDWTAKVASCVAGSLTSELEKSQSGLNEVNEERNIYETLRSREEFSQVVMHIDANPDVKKILEDDGHLITFFAPSNEAFKNSPLLEWRPGTGDEKKRCIRDMLKYHIVDVSLESGLLGHNSTIATILQAKDGSFGDADRRIKVQSTYFPRWQVTLNNYAQVTEGDIKAKNGVIHKINAVLFPPPDIMDIAFTRIGDFSYTTMALIKVDLQDEYEFNSDYKKKARKGGKHNDRQGRGSPMTTVFLPTNSAWEKLPEDLRTFLFSLDGEEALRKLMAWHTIPNSVIFSEWSRRKTSGSLDDEPNIGFESDYHYESLVSQKMPVHVKKYKAQLPGPVQYTITVQGHGVYSKNFDNPAQNGVIHAVEYVLCPRNTEGVNEELNQKDWDEWKDWFPEWIHNTKERKMVV